MARDATPDRIELVTDNFSNTNHKDIAQILEEEWDAQTTFSELGERYSHDRATFQKVYNSYFGVPEGEFNDGIDDPRTIRQLKDEFGSYKDYRELRKRGEVDIGKEEAEEDHGDTIPLEKAIEMSQESYRRGYQDGLQNAN